MTTNYYDRHGKDFARSTKDLDVDVLYAPFLELVPAGGHILDAGCGSGRDIKGFSERGYKVTAFDASTEMVRLASEFAGQKVHQMTFQEMTFTEQFDAIWACASLLHVPDKEMDDVLTRLTSCLKPGGPFYMSFKHGTDERFTNGRFFNDFTEEKLIKLIDTRPDLELSKIWMTNDIRPGRNEELWVNGIAVKTEVRDG